MHVSMHVAIYIYIYKSQLLTVFDILYLSGGRIEDDNHFRAVEHG